MKLIWKKEFSAGEPTIDHHHQSLFNFFNSLEKKIRKQTHPAEISTALEFFSNYLKMHFVYEENCMAKHRCPVAFRNKKAHQKLLKQIKNFKDRFKRGENLDLLLFDLHQTCSLWLKNHICRVDIHLRPLISPARKV